MNIFDPLNTVPDEAQASLDGLIAERMRTPFRWGAQDCVLWAADAVLAQTGTDHAAAYRGTYGTAEEAYALLNTLGGLESLGALVGEEIPVLMARAGDIGLCSSEELEHLAVCCGAHWLAPAKRGLAALPLSTARMAWRVVRG